MDSLVEGLSRPAQWPQGLAPPTGMAILPRLLAHACLRCERGGLRRPGAGLRACKGSWQPSRLYPICPIPVIVTRLKSGDKDVKRTQPFSYCGRGQ